MSRHDDDIEAHYGEANAGVYEIEAGKQKCLNRISELQADLRRY